MMTPEDAADFGQILADIAARRQAGQVQSQEASEAEAEAAVVTEAPATKSIPVAEAEVIQQNAQIQI